MRKKNMEKLFFLVIITLITTTFIFGGDILKFEKASSQIGYENIAIGKNCGSSGIYSPQYLCSKAVDGLLETAWGSALNPMTQWIYVDLGLKMQISGIGLKWYLNYYAKYYEIYISDNFVKWTKVYTKTNGLGGDEAFMGSTECRYIGILCIGKNQLAYGLKEFEEIDFERKDFIK